MCGIIGYIGSTPALPILIEGLERLEYRGYDSAGVAVLGDSGFYAEKCAGKIERLRERVNGHLNSRGAVGIGHTRWATHGEPTTVNAHPHFSCDFRIALVHNGIVENHAELRRRLQANGHVFASTTDTETIVHLLEEHYDASQPLAAVSKALREVRGTYALGILFMDHPDMLIGARSFSPLIVGVRPEGFLMASDIPAILPHTNDFRLIGDGEIAVLRRDGLELYSLDLLPRPVKAHRVAWAQADFGAGGYAHHMLKEIHDAPQVIRRELAGRLEGTFEELRLTDEDLAATRSVVIAACGTAWHAGVYAKYLLQELARLPVDCALASEVRYSPPPMSDRTLFIAISQSGETADTMQALRLAKLRGAKTLAITNTPASSIAREADGVICNRAGVEVGVAATKTYVAQLTALLLLTIKLSGARHLIAPLQKLPYAVEDILAEGEAIEQAADRFKEGYDFMYIGRRYNVATAYEGALKMKEISYCHAEGYAAGEMKHGPLALVDEKLAAVVIAPKSDIYDKIVSNAEEMRARKGRILAVVTRGDEHLSRLADAVFPVPETDELLSPLLTVMPLQLLAYHIATRLGRDVDRPRNLAKSVTVE